ncbi:putative ribonuclease H-like domain-containing protein [Tanacetum coccineum]
MVQRAVLMKSGQASLNTARQINTAHSKTTVNVVRPMSYLSKTVHLTVKRTIHKNTTFKNSHFNQRVNTVKDKNVNTIRPKAVVNAAKPKAVVNAARPKVIVNDVKGNNVNATMKRLMEDMLPLEKTPNEGKSQEKASGKADEGFFVRYSIISKAFRVFNSITRIVKENLHVQFSENTHNIAESGQNWLFDIDALTKSMNYKPVVTGNQSNGNAGIKAYDDVGKARMETLPGKDYILLPLWTDELPFCQSLKSSIDAGFKPLRDDEKKVTEEPGKEGGDPSKEDKRDDQEKNASVNSTNNVNVVSANKVNVVGRKASIKLPDDLNMPALEDIIYSDDDEDVGVEADMNNLDAFMTVFRNKKDERRIMIKNKARLVAQGYTQEEGINYDEVFAPVVRFEEIRLFLAYASFKDVVVYQMDVKSAFLYGKIEEEVYVCQPLGFEDPDFPNRRGKIDKTLFIRRDKGDILLVQVYVDDIIFGSTKKSLCTEFEKMMHKKFQISSIGELTFFLGLQVKYKEDGIFISQDKYVTDILKKFGFTHVKIASTPMETQKDLLKDKDGEEVDVYLYRSMIGSLMYLTSSKPDIMFVVCACARYQVNPKVSHLYAVKRIFRYLKGQPKLGLWYPKDSSFDLVAYTDSDYTGASLDRKFTIGVNAARHNLLLLLKVNAARHKLTTNAARHKLTTTVES